MKIIKSSNGFPIRVDDDTYPLLSMFAWNVNRRDGHVSRNGARIGGRGCGLAV